MASKLVPLNDAAVQLGVTPEELNEMRQRGEIYGYRDGASWKFKAEDVDRFQQERAGGGGSSSGIGDDLGLGNFGASSEEDMLLLGELGAAPEKKAPPSTGGGSKDKNVPAGDADPIMEDLELEIEVSPGGASDILAAETPKPAAPRSEAAQAGSSDILAGAIGASDSSSDIQLGASDILGSSDVRSGPGSSNVLGQSSDVLGQSSEVLINPTDSQIDPDLAASQTDVKKKGSGIGSDLNVAAESGVSLEGDDDIFGGPKSDVTHRPSDSGILLIDPGDSGLALDQPLDLSAAGSGTLATTEFKLGDTDESGSLPADDDFLLTPLEESSEDESDSGSQVIMLDTEGAESDFGEATATLLSSQIPGLLEEEASPLGAFGAVSGGGATATAAAGMVMVPAMREVPFPGWMVLLLAMCSVTLGLSGAMMYDLMLNIWSWEGPHPVNSAIMDMLVGK